MEGIGIAGELAHEQLRQLEPRPHGDRQRRAVGRLDAHVEIVPVAPEDVFPHHPHAVRGLPGEQDGPGRARADLDHVRGVGTEDHGGGEGRAVLFLIQGKHRRLDRLRPDEVQPFPLRPRNVFVFHEEERRDPAARGGDAGREQRRFHLDRPVRGGGPGREPSRRGSAGRRRPARRRTGRGGLFRVGGLPGLGRDGRVVLHRRNRRFLRSSGHQVLVYEKYGDRESDRQDHPFFLSHRSLFPKIWIRLGSSMPPGWNGWHLRTRQIPSRPPTIAPLRRTDPDHVLRAAGVEPAAIADIWRYRQFVELQNADKEISRPHGSFPEESLSPPFPESGEQLAAHPVQRGALGGFPDHDGRARPRRGRLPCATGRIPSGGASSGCGRPSRPRVSRRTRPPADVPLRARPGTPCNGRCRHVPPSAPRPGIPGRFEAVLRRGKGVFAPGGFRSLLAGDRHAQAFASLGATTGENLPSPRARHALAETVGPFPTQVVRLICTLHDVFLSFRKRNSLNP